MNVTDIAKDEAQKLLQSARAPEGVILIGRVFEFKAEVVSSGAAQAITLP
ncbi:MAG: hypothetical protein IRY95_06395 [Clostridia bacterium]|nr:hypothetical protein [Clostridia bacterium]